MRPLALSSAACQRFFVDEHKVAEVAVMCVLAVDCALFATRTESNWCHYYLLDVLSAYMCPTAFTFLFRAALKTKNRWLPGRFQSEI